MGKIRSSISLHWRGFLARLPLPTLALAAAYGVYSFQVIFTPAWVAVVSAASFELCYIGLAVARLGADERKRAVTISLGAVVVSVLYNSLSALFAIRPALLVDRPLWADIGLAVVHGLPLAVVAYLVADLLLHATTPTSLPTTPQAQPTIAPQVPQAEIADPLAALREEARRLRDEGASWAVISRAVGRKPATVRGWLAASQNGKH